MKPQDSLRLPRFYPILDTALYGTSGLEITAAAEALLDAGVRILQYRNKQPFTETNFQDAKRVAELCKSANSLFIMNDRADFARLLHTGVHLGQDDLPAASAREILGPDLPIGFSTHNEPQVRAAASLPVDYVAIGPVFHTASKSNPDRALGLAEFQRLRSLVHLPVVAIGGIDIDNALSVLDSGADAVAVISGLLPGRKGDLSALADRAKQWLEAVGVESPPL